jgi:hypothetical protein
VEGNCSGGPRPDVGCLPLKKSKNKNVFHGTAKEEKEQECTPWKRRKQEFIYMEQKKNKNVFHGTSKKE